MDTAAHASESKHLRQLTRAIQACSSWQQLQQLYATHRGSLNHIHTCCMLESLARVAPGAAGPGAGLCPEAQQEVVYLAQHLEELSGEAASPPSLPPPPPWARVAVQNAAGACQVCHNTSWCGA